MSFEQRQRTAQEVADVLKLVVETCPAVSEIRTLCSLLQVSRTVQQAMQQTAGHCSLVMPEPEVLGEGAWSTNSLARCCAWLPKHASLVNELSFGDYFNWEADYDATPDMAVSAHIMVNAALQLCAARAQPGALLPLRLGCLTLNWALLYPPILEPLSVCTGLTALDLTVSMWHMNDCTPMYAALGRLQGLQQLRLCNITRAGTGDLDSSFAGAISRLTQLQLLELNRLFDPSLVGALPSSLTALTLMLGNAPEIEVISALPEKCLGLHHLVHLQELGLLCRYMSKYPAMASLSPVVDLTALQQLRCLRIGDGMAFVPVIQQVSLVKQLQKLRVALLDNHQTEAVLRACLAGVAAATQLTQLHLEGEDLPFPRPLNGVQLHGYLKQLTQLQDLGMSCLDVAPNDAVHFTALTCLTALHMNNLWEWAQTRFCVSAAGALSRLPDLRVLELTSCGMDDTVLWLLGSATGLESLCIFNHPDHPDVVLDATVMTLLTGLTRLTSLLGPVARSSVEEYRNFRSAMPALLYAPEEPAA